MSDSSPSPTKSVDPSPPSFAVAHDPSELRDHKDARRALAAAMIAIGRAKDQRVTFEAHEEIIFRALDLLGSDQRMERFLATCGLVPGELAGEPRVHGLPPEAEKELADLVAGKSGARDPSSLTIAYVTGSHEHGFEVLYDVDGVRRHAFALPYEGGWFFAPGPVGRDDLAAVYHTFRNRFGAILSMLMDLKGTPPAEIREACRAVHPARALWPGERDPHGLVDTYPLVFLMRNPTPLERIFYCAFDPVSGKAEPYDHR